MTNKQPQFEGESQLPLQFEGESQVPLPVEKNKGGRPLIYSHDVADEICVRIAQGESLKRICDDDEMPCLKTVFNWLYRAQNPKNEEEKELYEGFLHKYARACDARAEFLFQETLEIADDASETIAGDDRSDSARIKAEELRIDTRKWYLSKVMPKKYGNKLDVTSDGDKIIASNTITFIDASGEDPE